MKRYWPFIFLPLGYALSSIAAHYPSSVEQFYSLGVFPTLARVLNLATGWIPFSLAEVLGILLVSLLIAELIMCIVNRSWRHLARLLMRVLVGACVLYFVFIVLWGLNYSRMPFGESAGLNSLNPTQTELTALCERLITEANALRTQVAEGTSGIMSLASGVRATLRLTQQGYDIAAELYPVLMGRYGSPKGVLASELMSYQGIGGIYMPFTGEANVNIAMPDSSIPFTAAHEVAHQHGYAREDEANFIAFLTCSMHPHGDFRYSGTLNAMLYAMQALYGQSPSTHAELSALISPAVKRDIGAERDFWKAHEGILERISNRINDAYLKANRQPEGVKSYGRMVDLLIAYYR